MSASLSSVPALRRRTRIDLVLMDHTRIVLRPVEPDDKAAILDGFEHLSQESRYRRFMGGVKRLTPPILAALTEVDHVDHEAWVAYAPDEPQSPGVGIARYVRMHDEPDVAEPAVTVIDSYQGRGLGTTLMDVIARDAAAKGIKRFRAFVLADNRPIVKILRRFGANMSIEEPGVLRAEIELDV